MREYRPVAPRCESRVSTAPIGLKGADFGCLPDRTQTNQSPDVVVMSAGLWHMLHIHTPVDFAQQLQRLKQAIKSFLTRTKVSAGTAPVTPEPRRLKQKVGEVLSLHC